MTLKYESEKKKKRKRTLRRRLTRFDLIGNRLGVAEGDFPSALRRMTSLRRLLLPKCRLRSVASFIRQLRSLETLDLRRNTRMGFSASGGAPTAASRRRSPCCRGRCASASRFAASTRYRRRCSRRCRRCRPWFSAENSLRTLPQGLGRRLCHLRENDLRCNWFASVPVDALSPARRGSRNSTFRVRAPCGSTARSPPSSASPRHCERGTRWRW